MWRGLYTAGTGMMTEMNRTNVISNNLANINTTGYKRERAIDREFEPLLIRRINDKKVAPMTAFKEFGIFKKVPVVGTLGLGSYTMEISTDFAQGAFQSTGNPLDVAISGEGYFVIETPNGNRYTRDGSFSRRTDGTLITSRGEVVQGQNSRPIVIPPTASEILIGSKGEVYADRVEIGRLALVEFNDRREIIKEGNNLFRMQEGARPLPATGECEQGVLERSNSNVITEMVDLINNYRVYEADAKALLSEDAMLDKAVNEVGRVV